MVFFKALLSALLVFLAKCLYFLLVISCVKMDFLFFFYIEGILFKCRNCSISPLPANRFWRAREPRFPSPLRRPRTTSLQEEEETKAAQRKWRFCWRIRKLFHTSHLSFVQSSEALAPIFSLAQHSRSCRTSSPLLTPSCSGKMLNGWYSLLNLICKLLGRETNPSSIPPLFPLTILGDLFAFVTDGGLYLHVQLMKL